MSRSYRKYDHRLKNLVAQSGCVERFAHLNIPKSTLLEWIRNGIQEVVTIAEFDLTANDLINENLELKKRLLLRDTEKNLVTKTLHIFGFQIQYKRLPSASAKNEILDAIKQASSIISLTACLEMIGLSLARYRAWIKSQVTCLLKDQPSCPKVSPRRLTATEILKIKQLFTSKEFAHISMLSLSWLAKRTGDVMASASTWSRVVRQYGLKRNRVRIYPDKPKIGIRAIAPGQIWHIDLTILRLKDGSRAFVQCVIDNFSRYVLAWKTSKEYGGLYTKELIIQAITKAKDLGLNIVPNVFADSGCENINEHVDSLIASNIISRTIAQIDVVFSNSMIEMLFHRLKHRHLFTIPLTNVEVLKDAVDFYLNQSNTLIPHGPLKGATPEEVITGKWTPKNLEILHKQMLAARKARIETNQSLHCEPCIA